MIDLDGRHMKNFVFVTNQDPIGFGRPIKVLLNLNAITYIASEPDAKGFYRVYLTQGGMNVSREDLLLIMDAIKNS